MSVFRKVAPWVSPKAAHSVFLTVVRMGLAKVVLKVRVWVFQLDSELADHSVQRKAVRSGERMDPHLAVCSVESLGAQMVPRWAVAKVVASVARWDPD